MMSPVTKQPNMNATWTRTVQSATRACPGRSTKSETSIGAPSPKLKRKSTISWQSLKIRGTQSQTNHLETIYRPEAPMPTRDDTEQLRKELVRQINGNPQVRESLERAYGQVWDTDELARDFAVAGFAAPFVVVVRKVDRVKGSLQFQHSPR